MRIRLGTRGSALALAQTRLVRAELARLRPSLEIEVVTIKTSGDVFSATRPDADAAPAGGKGLFVKELEEALADGRVDLAVHSAKDLPARLASGMTIAAYPGREDARDALISREGRPWSEFSAGMSLGTSSLRRRAQLAAAKPGLEFIPMRGNVDTRLHKLEQGLCDGLVLAEAGLRRLGSAVKREPLPEELVIPAPGQGALAVEARQEREELLELLSRLDHRCTRLEVELERSFLQAMGGGCSVPLAARARVEGGQARVSVFFSDPDGGRAVRLEEVCPDLERREEFGRDLAGRVLARRAA